MRVKGFDFKDFPCTFSSGGKEKSVEELSTLLKNITRSTQGATLKWLEFDFKDSCFG